MSVKPLSSAAPLIGAGGRATAYFQSWLVSLTDTLNAAEDKAASAAPATLNVVATGGLHRGGALNDDVGIAFYRAVKPVSQLPTTGNSPGDWAYAVDGRKPGETNGGGTGVPVFWSVTAWFAVTSGDPVEN